jgi:ATP-binding cassette subfamily F protein 3
MLKELEAQLDEISEKIKALETEITLPEIAADYEVLHEKCNEIDRLKQKSEEKTDEWLILSEKAELL